MSLHFSQHQFSQMADAHFLARVTTILLDTMPDAYDTLHTPEGRGVLQAQYDKALTYGFRSELDVGRYLITAWLLGVDFDQRFPAISEILATSTLTPSQKADAIEQLSTTLIKTLEIGTP